MESASTQASNATQPELFYLTMPISEIVWTPDDVAPMGTGPGAPGLNGGMPNTLSVQPGSGAGALLIALGVTSGTGTNFSVTAGSFTDVSGTTVGFISGLIGSINPASLLGVPVFDIGDAYDAVMAPLGVAFSLTGALAQNAFTSITLNGVTFLSVNASYQINGGRTNWNYFGATLFNLANGGVYDGNIT